MSGKKLNDYSPIANFKMMCFTMDGVFFWYTFSHFDIRGAAVAPFQGMIFSTISPCAILFLLYKQVLQ